MSTTTTTTTTSTTTSTTTTVVTTSTTTSDPPVTLASIFTTVNVLNGFVWLGARRNSEAPFVYKNDASNTVLPQPLFIDETLKYPDGKCAALLSVENDASKFHLHAVDCDSMANAVCKAKIDIPPPPGENLPKMPCIPPKSRKKRNTEENNCTEVNKENCKESEDNKKDNGNLIPEMLHQYCIYILRWVPC